VWGVVFTRSCGEGLLQGRQLLSGGLLLQRAADARPGRLEPL
jgi:hypothetical protein